MASNKLTDKIDLTPDEVERFESAMKNPEFMKLLSEYAKELENPDTMKEYQEYLNQVEKQEGKPMAPPGGGEVIFPAPGFCFKVRSTELGETKVFVNVCSSDKVDRPEEKSRGEWRIPLSLGAVRNDVDTQNKACQVIDIVYHPEAIKKGESDAHFKRFIIDLSMDYVEQKHGIKLKRNTFKILKVPSKGEPQWQTIRTKNSPPPTSNNNAAASANGSSQSPSQSGTGTETRKALVQDVGNGKVAKLPSFEIVHSGQFDMTDYMNSVPATSANAALRLPKQLIVKVNVNECTTAAHIDADVESKRILLEFPKGHYDQMTITLPFEVDPDEGTAQFDKPKRVLTFTLPVVQPKVQKQAFQEPVKSADEQEIEAEEARKKQEERSRRQREAEEEAQRVKKQQQEEEEAAAAVAEEKKKAKEERERKEKENAAAKAAAEAQRVEREKYQQQLQREREAAANAEKEKAESAKRKQAEEEEEKQRHVRFAEARNEKVVIHQDAPPSTTPHAPSSSSSTSSAVMDGPSDTSPSSSSETQQLPDVDDLHPVSLAEFVASIKFRNTLVYELD
jgi:hypothetical protein